PDATRRGMLVTADGGPGYAGTDDLFPWASMDRRFADEFDTVYFDLRGVKTSGHLACDDAAAAFYLGGLRVADAADEATLTAKSKQFAHDCVAEMGIPVDEAPFYSTAQAVEDLEAFRRTMGVDELTLYGLSYGTQFMQVYAARHPDRVRALLLDGTVDTTLGHVAYMSDLDGTIEGLLDRTLDDCAARPACASAFDAAPGATAKARAHAGYDAIAAALETAPVTLDFPLAGGGTSKRIYSRADLDTTTFDALYDPVDRGRLEAALGAAYSKGDFMPLLRLSYSSAGIDGQTAGPVGTAAADPGMSDAIYYTFTCNDYGADAPTAAARQHRYLAGGRALWSDPRVLSPYYGDDPCAYWPVTAKADPPPPAALAGVPTMVVGANADGAVPFDQGVAVASRLDDGSLVEVDGGHHVMVGTGLSCVDAPATAFLLDLARPPQRTTHCQGTFVVP
ncbi:MAG TPA: alpha/beta fold hydrolase, partial [Minicystis sp.]|nr:alpha/beta fold hydrolase [Minicystis sp.]